MSRRYDIQSAEGVIADYRGYGVVHIAQNAAPTNGVIGYAPGCLWVYLGGTAGGILYVNQGSNGFGSNATATWLAIA